MTNILSRISPEDQYDPAERKAFLEKLPAHLARQPIFVHYKGGVYLGLEQATHTESGEALVVYMHLWPHNDPQWWARPADMFYGDVKIGSQRFTRFTPIRFAEGEAGLKTNDAG